MKLAHFSDLHVTTFPLQATFALKRVAAVASYTLMGRGRDFAGSDQRIARLLEDVDALGVDHALCTGDVTGVAADAEVDRMAALYGERLKAPARHTLFAGNHDRYVAEAVTSGRFDRHFGALGSAGPFPLVKALPGNVTLVCVDSARPTSVIDSLGLVGDAQRARLLGVLTDASLRDRFVVVALHYGLLRSTGARDRRRHGLRDDAEMLELLDRADVFADLVVHGHLHTAFTLRTGRRQVVNAGSATDLHTACGYNLYDIDAARFHVKCSRRVWSRQTGAYVPALESRVAFERTTR
jgi:3',5'-cyclic AMP phosphodiesterase CpdA